MVEHSLWEREVVGSNPIAPIPYTKTCMEIIEVTEAEAEERLEEMVDSCETGQVYAIVRPDGTKIMMVPADPSLIPDDYADLYYNHDDAC